MRLLLILCVGPLTTAAFQAVPPGKRLIVVSSIAPISDVRITPPIMQKGRDADGVGGAAANTFSDIFSSIFKPSSEKQAEIDRAYAEQLEVAERRKNPQAYRKKIAQTEARRAAASQEAKGALVAGLVCCACVAGHVLLGVGDQDGPCAAVLRVLPSSLFPCLLMAATAAGVTALEAWHGDPRVLAGPCGDGRGVDASPLTYTGPRKKDGTPDRRFKVGREWARRHAAM